jgi:hypothetical protein
LLNRVFGVAALVLLCATTLSVRAHNTAVAPEWNLSTLMNALHQVRSSTARFVETKYLHLLNQAQRSSGRLIYVAPDRLQKETIEPTTSRVTIAADRLSIERPGEPTRDISLRDHPEIGGLVESIRATLAGDLAALTRYFTVTLEGGVNSWTLSLTPGEPKLRELVTAIHIKGDHATIREIETTEADGDRTDTVVTPDSK